MLRQQSMDALKQIAKGIALQFGPNCEVVIHEISDKSAYSSIVAIENGHVTGRKVGDGPSHVVLELSLIHIFRISAAPRSKTASASLPSASRSQCCSSSPPLPCGTAQALSLIHIYHARFFDAAALLRPGRAARGRKAY